MSIAPSPVESAENWEQVRDEWIAALDALFRQVETWSEGRGWSLHRQEELLQEGGLGAYQAWSLIVRAPEGRLLFLPIARRVTAAKGLVDLFLMPSIDATYMLVRHDDGRWLIHPFGNSEIGGPLSETSYFETARAMFGAML